LLQIITHVHQGFLGGRDGVYVTPETNATTSIDSRQNWSYANFHANLAKYGVSELSNAAFLVVATCGMAIPLIISCPEELHKTWVAAVSKPSSHITVESHERQHQRFPQQERDELGREGSVDKIA
jgi:hypothetical protein